MSAQKRRPKAVEAWAIVVPPGEGYFAIALDNHAPALYGHRKDAEAMRWGDEEVVRVRIVPVRPRASRKAKKRRSKHERA